MNQQNSLQQLQQQVDTHKTNFYMLLIVFVGTASFALFDSLYLDPKALQKSLKFQAEELEAEKIHLKEQYQSEIRLLKSGALLQNRKKLSELHDQNLTLKNKIQNLKQELSTTKQEANQAREESLRTKGLVQPLEARAQRTYKELVSTRRRLKDIKATGDRLFTDYKALQEQHTIFIDSICQQLVRLRKSAPAKTPKTHINNINKVIQRIRNTQKAQAKRKLQKQ